MPKKNVETQKQLVAEIEDLRARLEEAEEVLRAIRNGEVDALVVPGADGDQVFTLKGADESYRLLVEDMTEGALTLTAEGVILYANRCFAEMLKTPLEKVIGSDIHTWVAPGSQKNLRSLLRKGMDENREELLLTASDGAQVPVYFSVRKLPIAWISAYFCLVVTDLTEQKRSEAIAKSEKSARDALAVFKESRLVLLSMLEDQKQVEDNLRIRLSELEAINRISTALRVAQTVDEMLPRLLDETLTALEAEAGIVFLYDAGRDEIRKAVARGGWFNNIPDGPLPAREGITAQALALDKPYLSREFHSDPRLRETVQQLVPSGWGGACIPIHAATEIVGFFFISVQLPRELSSAEVRILTTLTEIAGNAIQRARLYEQTLRHVERLTTLHLIDTAISSSLDLRLTFDVTLSQVIGQMRVDAVAVLLFNPQSLRLEYAASRGFRRRDITHLSVQVGQDHAGRAASERKIVHIPNLAEAPFGNLELTAGEGFVTYCAAPLIAKGQLKGVLELFFRAPFAPDLEWTEFLGTLAGQLAIAIDNTKLFEESQRLITDLALAYDATIDGWSKALDLRDNETEGHSQRVTSLTLQLSECMNIPAPDLVHIRRGGLLHDIGKMGIPDSILLKPGQLSAEEWLVMRKHPQFAFDMLSPIPYLHQALDIPYCHHEKWDGSGYPRGLKGEQIPLAARLFAPVDVYDALTSDRPYRAAWSKEKTMEYIRNESGSHFDPAVVEAFLKLQI